MSHMMRHCNYSVCMFVWHDTLLNIQTQAISLADLGKTWCVIFLLCECACVVVTGPIEQGASASLQCHVRRNYNSCVFKASE